MEIGSFIELELKKGNEYYKGDNVARLNSARAGIYHALRILDCNTANIPYYQCNTVRDFLLNKGIKIKYYHIDSGFNPIDLEVGDDEAVLLVNYYGIMSGARMGELAAGYKNVIIDNSQAFFAKPIDNCMNVYSPRKFFGVPDGCYVIGNNANRLTGEYGQDYSSDTSLFLLKRIEAGCEKSYADRMENEKRIDRSDILKMSGLTHAILDGIDYQRVIAKRRENFMLAKELFDSVNKLDVSGYYDKDCIPMVYPLVYEDDGIMDILHKNKIFQGRWWSYLLDEVKAETFEYYISRYIIPITIDQRYGADELKFTRELIK
ncbi:MAG: hypothetical protein BWY15_01217 [Firmicutes bacterium ADurb.Bin193]|nr:MAG: hypothetical protein BWY15_01217 [Firmicutes bacterium ADurb.Bin193]